MTKKKMLCLILSALLCLSLFSCKKEEPVTRTETESAETKTEETKEIEKNDVPENELLGDVESWLGASDNGPLKDAGSYETRFIETSADLDPYRSYFAALSAEDEKRMLEDKNGKILLVEMTGDTQHTLYSTANIIRYGKEINIYITKCESEEEILPFNTYFLFYFPSTLYHGENITVTF